MKKTSLLFMMLLVTLAYLTGITNNAKCPRPVILSVDQPASGLSTSINDLGSDLVKMMKESGNYLVSPMSIHAALSMVYLGAMADTASEMETAFKFKTNELKNDSFHVSYAKLLDTYNNSGDQYVLFLANALFAREGVTLKNDYSTALKKNYKADVTNVDFKNNENAAKDEINKLVADKTRNMVMQLLSDPITKSTLMEIISAVYFKGKWETQFDKEKTVDSYFHTSHSTTEPVKLMKLVSVELPYFECNETGFRYLEMPYKSDFAAMVLALPKEGEYKPELEFTSALMKRINQRLQKRKIEVVKIPKFHLEYKKQLKESLQEIGIRKMFTTNADLSGISDGSGLFVDDVVHQSVIDVDEEGSEAKAVSEDKIFVSLPPQLPPSFIADRPFLFYIVDKKNMVVLFSGRLVQP